MATPSYYHPRSVTVAYEEDGLGGPGFYVYDASYTGEARLTAGPYKTYGDADRVARVRRATIKGALTRRANKARRLP